MFFVMETTMPVAAILLSVALVGCSRSQTDQIAPAKNQVETRNKKTELTASGVWRLYRGKAVDTLKLTDIGGVINGSVTLDPAWGGETFSLHGIRVQEEVEMFYSSETRSEEHTSELQSRLPLVCRLL